ncbi:Proteasome subunit [uncultured archaeon]|nr:Proteasome subunit [uncultured archaeon]
MTLIIGIKCIEGVLLVSDTKVTYPDGDFNYTNKILKPFADAPCLVAASGSANLFQEFNRKIPILVRERIQEITFKNIAYLKELKLDPREFIAITETEVQTEEPKKISEEKDKIEKPILPYLYTGEDFLDDCKKLVKEICDNNRHNDIDVFIALWYEREFSNSSLHHIYFDGSDVQVNNIDAIGSGSYYAKYLLNKIKNKQIGILEAASLACFAIKHVETLKMDYGVGVADNEFPQIACVSEDGRMGILPQESIKNIKEVFENIDSTNLTFKKQYEELKIVPFESDLFKEN